MGKVRLDAPAYRPRAQGRISVSQQTTTGDPAPRLSPARDTVRLGVVIGALGVVFGDIGTSPIYTLQTVFNLADPRPVPVSPDNVFGVVSLM
jgi:KUP system potassium uptake protein